MIGKRISQFNSTEPNRPHAREYVGWKSVTVVACCGLLFGCMVTFVVAGGGSLFWKNEAQVMQTNMSVSQSRKADPPTRIVVASYPGQTASELVERSDLRAQLEELDRIEKRVSWKLSHLKESESARVSRLVGLYDRMEPQRVARMISEFDDATVSDLLLQMRVTRASEVMALLSSEKATRVSRMIMTLAVSDAESSERQEQR